MNCKTTSILSITIFVAALAAGANLEAAQKPGRKPEKQVAAKVAPALTLEAISRDPDKWGGSAPSAIRWSDDGSKLHFMWNPERADRAEQYELDLHSPDAKPRRVTDEEKRWLTSHPGERNKADTLKVYAFQGDLYLEDLRTGKVRAITHTTESESDPRFSFDGQGVIFQRADNLMEWVIETGELRQITDFRTGKNPDEKPKLNKQEENLEKQQLDLFEIVRKQDKDEKEQKERTKRERGPFPESTYLKENESVTGLQLSPDRKYVTFILNDRGESSKVKVPEMPKYVTKSGYVETERLTSQIGGFGRVKVGGAQPRQKLGILSTADGKIAYVEMGLDKREYRFQPISSSRAGSFPGSSILAWSGDGKSAFCVLRAVDNKDRWIMLLDVANAKARVLDSEHDDAWIMSTGPFGWMPDNQALWLRSERDGFFQLYRLSVADGKTTPLTTGKWEITDVQVSRDGTRLYLTTSESHPGERHLYSMPITGGERTRITAGEGVFAATLSPDEKWIAAIYSSPDSPGELYLMENKPGEPMRRLTDSYTGEFKSYEWAKFQVFTFPDADNNLLYARLYRPDKPHPMRPAVIYVHGAGYAQSVYKNWGGFSTTPFFNVLLEAGYTVLDLDYRGSSGYGRDCRAAIYRNMGGKDIDSAVAAAKWLAATQGVDARRIGIYGGSYGGFFTLMALFKHPGVFAAGAALYPVTDWAHYNQPYTSNILNLPYDDEEAYRRSSPIYHAQGLQDRLLILHGMFDRNVNYQDSVRLIQHLIELKKTGWELATMPVEDHGWRNEPSRLDSNRRVFALFEEVLKRPVAPMAAAPKAASPAGPTARERRGN